MRIDRFQMERTQCLYENEVRGTSGVLPLRVEELLEGDEPPSSEGGAVDGVHVTARRVQRGPAVVS
jgi:hypothetical protein